MRYARAVCSLMIVATVGAAPRGAPPGAGFNLKGGLPQGAGPNLKGPPQGAGPNLKGPPQGAGPNLKGPPQGAGPDLPLQSIGSDSDADATEESCFVSAINAARSSAALAPLGTDEDLLRVARAWSARMAAAGDISHNPNVADLAPPDWRFLGENVGFGPTCDSIIEAFMNSPEHLKNILDPSYSSLGVGVVDGSDGLMYVTEDFIGTGGTSVQAAHGPGPRPVDAAAVVPVAPPPAPVAERAAPAPVAIPIPHPSGVPVPRAAQAPASKFPAPPAPKATAVPVRVALPIMDPALPLDGDTAPRAGLQKGILGRIVNALDAFFAV